MAIEPEKIQYGGDLMLFLGVDTVNKFPIAFSTSAKLEITLDVREISSKDSGRWKEKQAAKLDWKASTDALYTETLTGLVKTGTVTTAIDSETMTGTGTAFTTELGPGDILKDDTGDLLGVVLSIESDTSLTLSSAELWESGLPANAAKAVEDSPFIGNYANDYAAMFAMMVRHEPIGFTFAATQGTAANWSVDEDREHYTGEVFITGITANAPDNETTTYSISLEAAGPLTKA